MSLLRRKKKKLTYKSLVKKVIKKTLPKCPACLEPLQKPYKTVAVKFVAPNASFLSETIHCTRAGCIAKGTADRAAAAVTYQDSQRKKPAKKSSKNEKKKTLSLFKKRPKKSLSLVRS